MKYLGRLNIQTAFTVCNGGDTAKCAWVLMLLSRNIV